MTEHARGAEGELEARRVSVIGWPVVGFMVGSVTGDPTAWHQDKQVVRLCTRLTWLLALPCVLRVVVLRACLQQPFVGREHPRQLAALLAGTGGDHRLHLVQRGGRCVAVGLLVLGEQRIAVALLGGIHPLLQERGRGQVAFRLRVGGRRGKGCKQDDEEGGKRGHWTNWHQQWGLARGNAG